MLLMLNVLPQLTARPALRARARLQAALSEFYVAKRELAEDVSEFIRVRAATLREFDVPDADVGVVELLVLPVVSTNTIPTVFWYVTYVFSTPGLAERLCDEVTKVVERDEDGKPVINADRLEAECPLLVASFRESLRLCNHMVGVRRVMKDTSITDADGVSYTLKEGCDVQFSGSVSHRVPGVWGPSAAGFDPENFLAGSDAARATSKAKKMAYHPFGGGFHLCPGRNFAMTETLGYVAALLLWFEVQPIAGAGAPWELPDMLLGSPAEAVAKPTRNGEGFGVRIRKKVGWEDCRVAFEC